MPGKKRSWVQRKDTKPSEVSVEPEQFYSSSISFDELAITSFYSNLYLLLSENELIFTLGI